MLLEYFSISSDSTKLVSKGPKSVVKLSQISRMAMLIELKMRPDAYVQFFKGNIIIIVDKRRRFLLGGNWTLVNNG